MILLQSLAGTLVFSLLLAVLGAGISSSLPAWLGGDVSIRRDASIYFFIFSIFLPVLQMIFLAGGMLRCSGNMRIPSLLGVIMCVLDVVFNFFLIFPTRGCSIASMQFTIPGAGLGVSGAALGTAAAETVVAGVLLWYLLTRSEKLSYRSREGSFRLKADSLSFSAHSVVLRSAPVSIFSSPPLATASFSSVYTETSSVAVSI